MFHTLITSSHNRHKHLAEAGVFLESFLCRGGHVLHNRQDRAFHRTHHAFIGSVSTFLHGAHQQTSIHRFVMVERARETAPDLRKDDAAVTSGSHKSALGKMTTNYTYIHRAILVGFSKGCLHGEDHVGTGVTIWHWKDV